MISSMKTILMVSVKTFLSTYLEETKHNAGKLIDRKKTMVAGSGSSKPNGASHQEN
jgi:hypothetical protein